MNKIITSFGLLVFFISVIIFAEKGMPILDVMVRSLSIYVVVTLMFGLSTLAFIKAINKTSSKKRDQEHNLGN